MQLSRCYCTLICKAHGTLADLPKMKERSHARVFADVCMLIVHCAQSLACVCMASISLPLSSAYLRPLLAVVSSLRVADACRVCYACITSHPSVQFVNAASFEYVLQVPFSPHAYCVSATSGHFPSPCHFAHIACRICLTTSLSFQVSQHQAPDASFHQLPSQWPTPPSWQQPFTPTPLPPPTTHPAHPPTAHHTNQPTRTPDLFASAPHAQQHSPSSNSLPFSTYADPPPVSLHGNNDSAQQRPAPGSYVPQASPPAASSENLRDVALVQARAVWQQQQQGGGMSHAELQASQQLLHANQGGPEAEAPSRSDGLIGAQPVAGERSTGHAAASELPHVRRQQHLQDPFAGLLGPGFGRQGRQ